MRNPSLGPEAAARAALESPSDPLSGAENSAAPPRADSPAEAEGRRTLSTAFVRGGPDGYLTVELRDGRAVVLRDVVMRPGDYCGTQVLAGATGGRYCGGYGDIAAARPGGGPVLHAPDPGVANPVRPARDPVKGT